MLHAIDEHEPPGVLELPLHGHVVELATEDGAIACKNKSKRSIRNPNAMTAIAVRTQARNVRSFAEWSLKFLIMLSERT